MKIILTIISLLFCLSSFAQISKCQIKYQDLEKQKFLEKELKKWVNNIEKEMSSLNVILDSCDHNQRFWKIIYEEKFPDLKAYINHRLNSNYINKGDQSKMKEKWRSFQNDLLVYEALIFKDTTLTYVKRKMDSIYTADTPNYNGIKSFKKMDKKVDELHEKVETVNSELDTNKKRVKELQKTTNAIHDILTKRDTDIKNILIFSGYSEDTYGAGFLHVFDPGKQKISPPVLMAELVFPTGSQSYNSPWVFILSGVQHRNIVLLAGLGVIQEQLSWKGNIIYFPPKSFAGFGLSYSPLTDWGLSVSLNPFYFKSNNQN